jgi:hypothetical protein
LGEKPGNTQEIGTRNTKKNGKNMEDLNSLPKKWKNMENTVWVQGNAAHL